MMERAINAVETRQLVKAFGGRRAVDGVNLVVPAGSVLGLLGPNGAGKTTTIRVLATLLRPDSGSARVFGHDVARSPQQVRRMISLTGQFASIDEDLSGSENLVVQARLLGLGRGEAQRRATELLESLDLADAARRQVKTYSGGMKRRLDIAAGIVVIPDLLFLDEPTTGLDPRSRNQVWDVVRQLVGRGTTVLLTTQYLDEADQLSDRVAVIDHGRIVADDTPSRLKASVGTGVLRVHLAEPNDRSGAIEILSRALQTPVETGPDPAELQARLRTGPPSPDPARRVAHALAAMSDADIAVTGFDLGQPSLDEVFLALTGHPADDTATEEVA